MNDNVKINFGNSSDLQIHHDGTHSRINDNGSGALLLQTNGSSIQLNKGTSENMLIANIDADVELYYNGSKKFETKSDGVDIVGELQCDSLDVDAVDITGNVVLHANLDLQDDDVIQMGNSNDLKIFHNATNSHIQNYTGGLYIDQHTNDNDIQLRTDNGSGSITTYVLCEAALARLSYSIMDLKS